MSRSCCRSSSPSISSASSPRRARRSARSGERWTRTPPPASSDAACASAIAIGLFLAMLIICLPGLWIVLSSLRPTVEIMAKPPVWIPQSCRSTPMSRCSPASARAACRSVEYFRNSLIISVTSTVIAIVIGMAGGYAFARFRFQRQVRLVPRPDADPHRARHRALAAALLRLCPARHHRHAFRPDPRLCRAEHPLHHLADRRLLPAGAARSRRSRADRWLHALAGLLAGRVSARRPRHRLGRHLRLPHLAGTNSRWPRSSPARSTPRRCRSACSTTRPSSPSTGAACARWPWS